MPSVHGKRCCRALLQSGLRPISTVYSAASAYYRASLSGAPGNPMMARNLRSSGAGARCGVPKLIPRPNDEHDEPHVAIPGRARRGGCALCRSGSRSRRRHYLGAGTADPRRIEGDPQKSRAAAHRSGCSAASAGAPGRRQSEHALHAGRLFRPANASTTTPTRRSRPITSIPASFAL